MPTLWDRLSDQILTAVSNGLTNVALSDVTTSYQAFRADVVRGAVLRSDGCGIAGELASLFTTRQCRIFEVPVSHRVRPAVAVRTRWIQWTFAAHHDGPLPSPPLAASAHRPINLSMSRAGAPRGARLTRLVLPMDLMPMSYLSACTSHDRPICRAI